MVLQPFLQLCLGYKTRFAIMHMAHVRALIAVVDTGWLLGMVGHD